MLALNTCFIKIKYLPSPSLVWLRSSALLALLFTLPGVSGVPELGDSGSLGISTVSGGFFLQNYSF